MAQVTPLVASLDASARCVVFGHLGVGNLHVNVLGVEPDDERVDDAVLRLVADLGGSIGAEHGIGAAKRDWLRLTRAPADLAAMRAIKRALDPQGLLNPGVLLPPAES
jgi:FAD/FMN-containing dehydrogenase